MQALAFFLACLFVCGHSMPEDLRVDYLVAPTIDNPEPRFSWRTPSVGPARAQMQAGYRLTVTESGSSNNMLFDSGPIQSNQSTFVTAALAGKLKSNTRCTANQSLSLLPCLCLCEFGFPPPASVSTLSFQTCFNTGTNGQSASMALPQLALRSPLG